MNTVTVIVPSIPTRPEMLARALASVAAQNRKPDEILVRVANDRMPAAQQRDELLAKVTTEWVACLDDDDELYPRHLELLMLRATGEIPYPDLVYPWFDVIGGTDPFPQFEGKPWDALDAHQVPITALYRTESVRACGGWWHGWQPPSVEEGDGVDATGNRAGEDLALIRRMNGVGMKIVHLPIRTWAWYHHSANTMGLPSRW